MDEVQQVLFVVQVRKQEASHLTPINPGPRDLGVRITISKPAWRSCLNNIKSKVFLKEATKSQVHCLNCKKYSEEES